MAFSTPFGKAFCVGFVCLTFVALLPAQTTNQPQGDGNTGGQGSSFFFYQKPEYPRDCSEVRNSCSSSVSSGVNLIKPDGYEEPFEAYCDNDIASGGWTVILRRFDGSVGFNRDWNNYKAGFGFLSSEFWLGHNKLAFLTNQVMYELRIDITLKNGTSCDVRYDAFRISDEWSNFTMSTVGTYESEIACRWKEADCDTPEECDSISTNFTDCNDVYNAGHTQDGVYFIRPAGQDQPPFEVFCNMSIDGGSWTVIQRRVNGSTDFYRNWADYKKGFGNIQHEFWLGNDKLHNITRQATYEYRFDYVFSSTSYYNKYSNFRVDNEANKYRLANVGSRTGSGGWSLFRIGNTPFSTHDEDNDGQSYDCAEGHRSGWWHGADFFVYSYDYCLYFQSGSTRFHCSRANPNGDYNGGKGQSIFEVNYNQCNQTYTEMKIRRIS